MIPYLTGEVKESPRNAIMYFSDDGEVMAVRVGDYKFNLAVATRQYDETVGRAVREASAAVYHEPPSRPVRAGRIQLEHLLDWMVDHVPQMYLMQAVVAAEIDGLRQVPAAAETGLVQPGRGAGAGDAPRLSRPSLLDGSERGAPSARPRKQAGLSTRQNGGGY